MATEPNPAVDAVALDRDSCWQLLARAEVGRLAVSIARHPDIFPVNFAVVDESIVFRTAEGTKLVSIVVGPAVAFEVDGFDAERGEAWSVVVKGTASEVDVFDAPDDSAFPIFPWSATPKPRFVRITADSIDGRRFRVVGRRPR